MTFGELFAGIGGFSLGLERAGMECKWQVEIDRYASAVLAKHWPNVRRHDDVKTFPPHTHTHTHTHDFSVDLICGGFPCQDISVANVNGQGIKGSRSGLWNDFARIIRAIQPRWVVIENVPAITNRGLSTVLSDLAEIGFDAEWHCLSASSVGAPHRRERMWIVAHTNGSRCQQQRRPVTVQTKQLAVERCDWWSVEPKLGRVANGLPARVDRLRCLGNAVVPQVVEVIGRAIMQAEEMIVRDSATTQQQRSE